MSSILSATCVCINLVCIRHRKYFCRQTFREKTRWTSERNGTKPEATTREMLQRREFLHRPFYSTVKDGMKLLEWNFYCFMIAYRRHGGLRNTRNGTKSGENVAKKDVRRREGRELLIIEDVKACDDCKSVLRDLRKTAGVIGWIEDNQSQCRKIFRMQIANNECHIWEITCDGLLN